MIGVVVGVASFCESVLYRYDIFLVRLADVNVDFYI